MRCCSPAPASWFRHPLQRRCDCRARPSHQRTAQKLRLPAPEDNDQTLHALRDEMARSQTRLTISGAEKPFHIQYQLLDIDARTITTSFGALLSSTNTRSRFMLATIRVGDYHLDSSNFVSDEGFRGFLGSAGQVGIDRDYNSLRQDLWLSTDQAYKEALTQMSVKRAFLRSLTKPPEIDDFSKAAPVVQVEPRLEPDWTSRNWEDEARAASKAVRGNAELKDSRVTYYLIYTTYYLLTSEGTEIRVSRSFAAIEGGMDALADDGMEVQNFYAKYVAKPADLPSADEAGKSLADAARELVAASLEPARARLYRSDALRCSRSGLFARAGLDAVALRRPRAAFHASALRRNDAGAGRPQRMDRTRGHARVARRRFSGGRSRRSALIKGSR